MAENMERHITLEQMLEKQKYNVENLNEVIREIGRDGVMKNAIMVGSGRIIAVPSELQIINVKTEEGECVAFSLDDNIIHLHNIPPLGQVIRVITVDPLSENVYVNRFINWSSAPSDNAAYHHMISQNIEISKNINLLKRSTDFIEPCESVESFSTITAPDNHWYMLLDYNLKYDIVTLQIEKLSARLETSLETLLGPVNSEPELSQSEKDAFVGKLHGPNDEALAFKALCEEMRQPVKKEKCNPKRLGVCKINDQGSQHRVDTSEQDIEEYKKIMAMTGQIPDPQVLFYLQHGELAPSDRMLDLTKDRAFDSEEIEKMEIIDILSDRQMLTSSVIPDIDNITSTEQILQALPSCDDKIKPFAIEDQFTDPCNPVKYPDRIELTKAQYRHLSETGELPNTDIDCVDIDTFGENTGKCTDVCKCCECVKVCGPSGCFEVKNPLTRAKYRASVDPCDNSIFDSYGNVRDIFGDVELFGNEDLTLYNGNKICISKIEQMSHECKLC